MAVAPAHDRCACDALVCLQFRVSENEDFVRNVLVRRLIVREYLRRRSESTSLSHLRRGDCLVYGAFDILRGTLGRDDVVDVERIVCSIVELFPRASRRLLSVFFPFVFGVAS